MKSKKRTAANRELLFSESTIRTGDCCYIAANGTTSDSQLEFDEVRNSEVGLYLWAADVVVGSENDQAPVTLVASSRAQPLTLSMLYRSKVIVGFNTQSGQPLTAEITVLAVYRKRPGVRLQITTQPV